MVRGGLTYREIHYICEELASTGRLVGMDLVEVSPANHNHHFVFVFVLFIIIINPNTMYFY
jgi:arginase family enzyme